jgi:HSP20 family protein
VSFWGIEPDDWFRRFFGGTGGGGRGRWRGSGSDTGDIFREFEDIRSEMERMFEEQFRDIQSTAPKELVREYETAEGDKIREIGPLVYGYSVTIGPDGKPKVREFGNVRSASGLGGSNSSGSPGSMRAQLRAEREPLADVVISDKEVKVVAEMPGIDKKDIKVNAYDNSVEIFTADTSERKYRRIIELPGETDLETAKSTYRNGILEITFNKKESPKQKGKQINIE